MMERSQKGYELSKQYTSLNLLIPNLAKANNAINVDTTTLSTLHFTALLISPTMSSFSPPKSPPFQLIQ